MSALEAAEELLSKLTRAEKAQLLRWAASDLSDAFPGIESRPGVCGGKPCIVRTRIPVWLLEQGRRIGISEAELLRSYPTLRAEDLATPGHTSARIAKKSIGRSKQTKPIDGAPLLQRKLSIGCRGASSRSWA